jgi:hypothetical protein
MAVQNIKIILDVSALIRCRGALIRLRRLAVPQNDLWSFDPAVPAWNYLSTLVTGDPPPPRWSHGIASIGNLMFIFGGAYGYYDGLFLQNSF